MKILITGATGFFGNHLYNKLQRDGHTVIGLSSQDNLMEPLNLPIERESVDKIYHLAVKVKGGKYNISHKGDTWLDNTLINSNIIKWWSEYQPGALFCTMGTSCAYSGESEMSEDNYLVGDPDIDLYGYAISKRDMLWGLKAINEQYGLQYQYFIPTTLCGTQFKEDDTHFHFDFIKKLCAGKYEGSRVTFWGDGLQRRELIDVDDAVNIISSHDELVNMPVNLSTGVEYPLRLYAKLICEIIDYDYNLIEWDENEWVGVRSKNLINTHFKDVDFTDIKETLTKATEFHVKRTYKL